MNAPLLTLAMIAGMMWAGGCSTAEKASGPADQSVDLGNFSVSLAVKDLAASRAFYEKLGMKAVGGDGKGYLIMQNETATIGLFQGMFEMNILTFNPGWDRSCATLPAFTDVRALQREFEARGLTMSVKADPASEGPASIMLVDPDGNPILIDQHVASPKGATSGTGR